jgi:hypothetical protein
MKGIKMRSKPRFCPSSLELNHYHTAGYHERAPEPRLPIGLAYLLAGAGSLFLWGLIGTALWQVFG